MQFFENVFTLLQVLVNTMALKENVIWRFWFFWCFRCFLISLFIQNSSWRAFHSIYTALVYKNSFQWHLNSAVLMRSFGVKTRSSSRLRAANIKPSSVLGSLFKFFEIASNVFNIRLACGAVKFLPSFHLVAMCITEKKRIKTWGKMISCQTSRKVTMKLLCFVRGLWVWL